LPTKLAKHFALKLKSLNKNEKEKKHWFTTEVNQQNDRPLWSTIEMVEPIMIDTLIYNSNPSTK